jgi:hypothetical protein
MATEEWREYISKTLRETIDRDRQPLGGQRPVKMIPMQGYGDNNNFSNPGFGTTLLNDDDEEDDMGGSDQFARYLAHQLTSDLPDKFDDGSSDDEEDMSQQNKEAWIR